MGSPVKHVVQRVLNSIGLLERARTSRLYDAYWRIAAPAVLRRRADEIAFYKNVLEGFTAGSLVFDVGANRGAKTDIFLRLGAHVVAIEPDVFNQHVLAQRFLSYRMRPLPVSIVPVAVAADEGAHFLWVDEPGSGKNTLNRKWVDVLRTDTGRFGHSLRFGEQQRVRTTTMERLISQHGEPFFVKVDVEGGELEVLTSLERPLRFVSFEVNLPEFLDEGRECVRRLEALSRDSRFNYICGPDPRLVLPHWISAVEFDAVLERCQEPSIEVFCRTP